MIECVLLAGVFWLKSIDLHGSDVLVRVDKIEAIKGVPGTTSIYLTDQYARTVLLIGTDTVIEAIKDCDAEDREGAEN